MMFMCLQEFFCFRLAKFPAKQTLDGLNKMFEQDCKGLDAVGYSLLGGIYGPIEGVLSPAQFNCMFLRLLFCGQEDYRVSNDQSKKYGNHHEFDKEYVNNVMTKLYINCFLFQIGSEKKNSSSFGFQ